MESMDFDEIKHRISIDDEAAFQHLFKTLYPGLLSFSTSILKDSHNAEDVLEEVFLKLWERKKTIAAIDNLSHYIYMAVRNTSINFLKKQKQLSFVSLEEVGEALEYAHSETGTQQLTDEESLKIINAVNELPPKCRLIFRLVKEEKMKYKEVAQLLDISAKTVENQMSIAMKKLFESLKKDFFK